MRCLNSVTNAHAEWHAFILTPLFSTQTESMKFDYNFPASVTYRQLKEKA